MDDQYSRRLKSIEAEIDRWLPESPGAAWQAEVFPGLSADIGERLLGALSRPGRDLVSRGGKRWRPLLMTLVCEARGGGDAALPLAPLVELSHTASLIHDDIEDGSDRRRGKPSAHIAHGLDAALNSGSFLYFLASACIDGWASAQDAPAQSAKAYALWAGFMRKLHLGQAMDIHWHREVELVPSVDEYLAMCALKTGCLARFAAELGALAAGALERDARELGEAAQRLGLGFQILDDVKNVSSGVEGKKRGDDIAEGKKSLPILLFLDEFPARSDMVFRCFRQARAQGPDSPAADELAGALRDSGALEKARAHGRRLVCEARAVFEAFDRAAPDFRPPGLLAALVDLLSA